MLPGESAFDRCTATGTNVGAERVADTPPRPFLIAGTTAAACCWLRYTLTQVRRRLVLSPLASATAASETPGCRQAAITRALNGSVREICGVAHVVSLAQRILGVMAHVR